MSINHLLAGSLTGMMLASGAPAAASTVSEKPHWIKAVSTETPREGAGSSSSSAPAVGAIADWKKSLGANIKGLTQLRPGWDGPGSIPIPVKLLSRAFFYVDSALKGWSDVTAPRFVPGGDGSVQIEWHTRRGELELDIDDRGAASIWIRDHLSGAEFDGEGSEALALFYRWAPWIAAQQRHASDVPIPTQMAPFAVAA